jgi:para-aminobenzoate synthetase/4-amino-4-deoxychorismate lyase
VIAAYGIGSRPMVLWGSWLDSEVIIGVDPLVEIAALDAADCWPPLTVWPSLASAPEGLGGGWFVALGYDPGASWLAFCDSVLRRRTDGRWVFESLGLMGREEATAAALVRARAALTAVAGGGDPEEATHGHGSQVDRAGPLTGQPAAALGPLSTVAGLRTVAGAHVAGVERVIGRIRAGELYQLNLCTRLTAELRTRPLDLFVRTASALRPAYGSYLPTGPDTILVSLSPERFLTLRGAHVTTSPIKGTTKRAEDPDGRLLRSSTKDAAENIMITDLMRNDLSRVCRPGSVAVTGLLEIRPHPGVWHLVSTVTGALVDGATASDLLAATFPPGSVTGAPKSSAVRAITAEEAQPRGAYTGAAGFLTPAGDAELSVLIRTFEVDGDRVELGVGGGITVDSVPVREWRECLHKAEPLALAAGSRLVDGLDDRGARVPPELAARGVFETILVQHGRPLRLADHLARLARSVRELYGGDLPADLPARVTAAATGSGPRSALRVHLAPTADVPAPTADVLATTVTVRPLGPRPATGTLRRADRPPRSWRHKWADRHALQVAERQTAPALPYFLDGRGLVAETSRGNLFVRADDHVWRTPPADDHLLPGVTRRALLDEFVDRGIAVQIAPVTIDDLQAARAVVWTSSLSGVVRVTEVDGRRLPEDGDGQPWSAWLGIR